MTCNAQAFINISRKRLCKGCASPETRQAWEIVIKALSEIDPILAEKCVPECIYRDSVLNLIGVAVTLVLQHIKND
jgi:hypothetical protein